MPNPMIDNPLAASRQSNLPGSGKTPTLQSTLQKPLHEAKLKAACQQFESLFLNMMLKEMRETIPKSELLETGQAEEIYTSMLDAQVSNELARKGGIGLASIIEKYLFNQSTEETCLNGRTETKKYLKDSPGSPITKIRG